MKRSKGGLDSQAVRTRTAWYLVVANVGGVKEVHVGYRFYDQSTSLYSTPIPGTTRKMPWGAIKGCEFKPSFKNGKGEVADYFYLENKKCEKRMFRIQMMNPLIGGITDFTQQCAGLLVSHKEETLAAYLTLMNSARGFLKHSEDIHDEWGFKKENLAEEIEELVNESGGSLEEYKEFVQNADLSALIVGKRVDVLKEVSTKPVYLTGEHVV